MKNFIKVLATSIAIIGFASTAHAGTVNKAPKTVQSYQTASLQSVATKRVVRKVKRLPMTHKAATRSTRTVLFYTDAPTRSKVIRVKAAKTSTPNLFGK